MAYTKKTRAYNPQVPPNLDNPQITREFLTQELRSIQIAVKSLADVVAEIQSKLASASSLPVT